MSNKIRATLRFRHATQIVFMASLLAALSTACAPQWHRGEHTLKVNHAVDGAIALEQSLSLQGWIEPLWSFTDYGIKVLRAQDDTGKILGVKSFQIFWMKEFRFEIELEIPDPAANSVTVHLLFRTRDGVQELEQSVPIERNKVRNYTSQIGRWSR